MTDIFNEIILPEAKKMLKKAVLPQKQTVAQTWTNMYFNELKNKRYEYNETGEIIVVDKAGHTVDNQHGWPMTGTDAIEETFNRLFDKNDLPDTEDEYFKRLKNPKITPAERIRLTEFWQNKDKV